MELTVFICDLNNVHYNVLTECASVDLTVFICDLKTVHYNVLAKCASVELTVLICELKNVHYNVLADCASRIDWKHVTCPRKMTKLLVSFNLANISLHLSLGK